MNAARIFVAELVFVDRDGMCGIDLAREAEREFRGAGYVTNITADVDPDSNAAWMIVARPSDVDIWNEVERLAGASGSDLHEARLYAELSDFWRNRLYNTETERHEDSMKPQMIPVRYLYHGSVTKLPVGGLLLPPSVTGIRRYHDADRNKIYLSTDIAYCLEIATEGGKHGWLYQVRPLDAVEPHDSDIIWNGRRGVPAGGSHFTTTKAKIVARAPVPKAFFANRVPLIEAHFELISALSTKADVFSRKLLKNDSPDDPDKWLVTRGKQRWEQTATTWKWLQDVDAKQEQMRNLFGRLYGFLEDHREEIIDAADEIPDVMRELLDLLDFRIETCAECGWTLNDADVRRGNGFCLDCESQQPD